ncbi:SDR family oxidoreductase [Kordiimonas sp. SCSIO 12610]|uniref:SDR family oxidoreductase n=1 Tax=Kordiimonas sp. SCSIO 12610 TaxID=2829597 RepID=UPI00210A4C3F|nr:SDR family oxidoreductase [Kordiimonas sp. SCSIO 12610]UTW56422.1 SDR family oxidoreductase [Kordiimonas sp. SCSIO 12610]
MTSQTGFMMITGAGKRVGRHLALYFGQKGFAVGIHYNGSKADAEEVADIIRAKGGKAYTFQTDLQDETAVSELIPKAAEQFDMPCNALINNASVFENDSVRDFDAKAWHMHMGVNTLAPLILTQAFEKLLPNGENGNIINIIDQRVWKPNPQFMTYTASKAALYSLTRTTAQALAPHIRVNAIGPGPVLESIHQTAGSFQAEADNVLLKKGPALDEIAKTVEFILSTPSMTGQMIALDGGQHLAWRTPDIVD